MKRIRRIMAVVAMVFAVACSTVLLAGVCFAESAYADEGTNASDEAESLQAVVTEDDGSLPLTDGSSENSNAALVSESGQNSDQVQDTVEAEGAVSEAGDEGEACPSSEAKVYAADEGTSNVASDDSSESAPEVINYYETTQPISTYKDMLWQLYNDGTIGDGLAGYDIDLQGATASSDVVVAVIDTGVAVDNPALKDYIFTLEDYPDLMAATGAGIYGYNALAGADKTDVSDEYGHGTHVAGIIVSATSNGGTSGGAKILPVRVGKADGTFSLEALVRAVDFVVEAKQAGINIVVANMSLGVNEYYPSDLRNALKSLVDAGIVAVVASGNSLQDVDNNPYSTSSFAFPGSLTVSSTNSNAQLSGFSNWGVNNVDVVAPGGAILSTAPGGSLSTYTSQLAYYNTVNDIPDSSRALYYEGFEEAGSTVESNIGGGLQFTYGTVSTKSGDTGLEYYITAGDTPVKIVEDASYMGSRSASFGTSNETRAIVSRVLNNSDLSDSTLLQAFNFYASIKENQGIIKCGIIDETGKLYETEDIQQTRSVMAGLWATLGTQKLELFPEAVRADLTSASPKHAYRLVFFEQEEKNYNEIYLDSVAVGYGMEGYMVWSGTSMAAPMVSAAVAIAATIWPDDDAQMRAARVRGGVSVNERYATACSSSGSLDVAGMADPAPQVENISIDGAVMTLTGYFFGTSQGSVEIGGQTAQIISWDGSDDLGTIIVKMPSGVADGVNTISVKSASGKLVTSRFNLGNVSNSASFTELASPYNSYGSSLGYSSFAVNSKGAVLINYRKSFHETYEDSSKETKFDLLSYDAESDTWSLPLTNVEWGDWLGLSKGTTVNGIDWFTLDDVMYMLIHASSADDSEDGIRLYRYDFDDATATQLFKLQGSVYSPTVFQDQVYLIKDIDASDKLALTGQLKSCNALVCQLDMSTGTLSTVCAYDSGDVDKAAEADGATEDIGTSYPDLYFVAAHYVGIVKNYADCSRLVWADMAQSVNSQVSAFQVLQLPYTLKKQLDCRQPSLAVYDKYIVLAGAVYDDADHVLLINLEDGSIQVLAEKMSDALASYVSARMAGTMLYLLGTEDALVYENIRFLRCLDLSTYLYSEPEPQPDPAPDQAPASDESSCCKAGYDCAGAVSVATGDCASGTVCVLALIGVAALSALLVSQRKRCAERR